MRQLRNYVAAAETNGRPEVLVAPFIAPRRCTISSEMEVCLVPKGLFRSLSDITLTFIN